MKENPLQYQIRGTPVPTTRTRGTNYPESTSTSHDISLEISQEDIDTMLQAYQEDD